MPSENSIYRKIQIVLEVAKSTEVNSIGELQIAIRSKNLVTFHTRHFDRVKDAFVTAISDKSIHSALSFCRDLKLLKDNGTLTPEGRQAIQRSKFDRVIADSILSYLQDSGVDIRALNKLILISIQSNPPVLPTCHELWVSIQEKTDFSNFAKMLNLLSQCGMAQSSQKKIYLGIKTNQK
ncbi:MAG TPA: hypothetical protein VGO56_22055 [Pyrinomonadaceae bacterium]|jgi:hypothetical protein|nr:hypothetical protein [Pyrinomonadaceae bacterium]